MFSPKHLCCPFSLGQSLSLGCFYPTLDLFDLFAWPLTILQRGGELISCAALCCLVISLAAAIFARVAGDLVLSPLPSGHFLKSGGGMAVPSSSSFLSSALSSRESCAPPILCRVHRYHPEAVGALLLRGHTLLFGGAPCLSQRPRGLLSLIACVHWRDREHSRVLALSYLGRTVCR